LWIPSGVGVEKEPQVKRSENVNLFEPSGAALRKRGVVWDPVSKLWVLEGEDEGDLFEKVLGRRGVRSKTRSRRVLLLFYINTVPVWFGTWH
jgi:hypothetical protein